MTLTLEDLAILVGIIGAMLSFALWLLSRLFVKVEDFQAHKEKIAKEAEERAKVSLTAHETLAREHESKLKRLEDELDQKLDKIVKEVTESLLKVVVTTATFNKFQLKLGRDLQVININLGLIMGRQGIDPNQIKNLTLPPQGADSDS